MFELGIFADGAGRTYYVSNEIAEAITGDSCYDDFEYYGDKIAVTPEEGAALEEMSSKYADIQSLCPDRDRLHEIEEIYAPEWWAVPYEDAVVKLNSLLEAVKSEMG